jgi:hypothetical protein
MLLRPNHQILPSIELYQAAHQTGIRALAQAAEVTREYTHGLQPCGITRELPAARQVPLTLQLGSAGAECLRDLGHARKCRRIANGKELR